MLQLEQTLPTRIPGGWSVPVYDENDGTYRMRCNKLMLVFEQLGEYVGVTLLGNGCVSFREELASVALEMIPMEKLDYPKFYTSPVVHWHHATDFIMIVLGTDSDAEFMKRVNVLKKGGVR